MQKGIGTIQILVILALLILAGSLGYVYLQPKQEAPKPLESEPAIETTTSVPVPSDETANWKTYQDDDLGFKLQYPSGWEFKAEFLPGGVVKDNFFEDVDGRVMTITPFLYDTNYTFEEYMGANFEPGDSDVRLSGKNKLIENDSMEAYLVPLTNGITLVYLRSKESHEPLIAGKYQKTVTLKPRKDLDINLLKKIISTFYFIER